MRMFWTEYLFSRLPGYGKGIRSQVLPRFLFLLGIWSIGLLAYLPYGNALGYLFNYQIYTPYFGIGMIVLMGAYALQPELKRSLPMFRPQLDLDHSQYEKLSRQVDSYCFSLIPVLLIAVATYIFISGGSNLFLNPVMTAEAIWNYFIIFIIDLLTATGIWMGAAIWLTIFLISRKPLKVDLSQDMIARFRRLTTMALWCSVFYFIALTIGLVIPASQNPSIFLGNLFYPLAAFILLGALGILLPFYNIHNALLSIKRRELNSIEAEFRTLQEEFGVSQGTSDQNTGDTIPLMLRFFTLQLRERQVRLAQEWPIDVSFVSKLLLLVLIPVIVRIITWIFIGLT
jgi:hypothetical protein